MNVHVPYACIIYAFCLFSVYNERLTMPKLNVIATCDEFFLPTDTHLYWDNLNGSPNNYMK